MGKPLLQYTIESAQLVDCIDRIIVATDDERIADLARRMGVEAVMTSPDCQTGSDRIGEVLHKHPELQSYEYTLNVQGDEPFLSGKTCQSMVEVLQRDMEAVISTPIFPLGCQDDPSDPSVVKCVCDLNGSALYFSRSVIPTKRNSTNYPYYKHIGLYLYRTSFLARYLELPPTPLQACEDLEQLRVLEHGFRIKTVVADEDAIGVNEPKDIKKIENYLCHKSISSSQAVSAHL